MAKQNVSLASKPSPSAKKGEATKINSVVI